MSLQSAIIVRGVLPSKPVVSWRPGVCCSLLLSVDLQLHLQQRCHSSAVKYVYLALSAKSASCAPGVFAS